MKYVFNFDDNESEIAGKAWHIFTHPGVYPVDVVLLDTRGNRVTKSVDIIVKDRVVVEEGDDDSSV